MSDLLQAVQAAHGRDDVHRAVRQLYTDVQEQIDLRKPACSMSGRCCNFKEYGHRLYVTTLELAAFTGDFSSSRDHREERAGQAPRLNVLNGICPLQVEGLCSVHTIRPFGCRIFFCDTTATQWQQEQYELFHSRLKKLHVTLSVPYFYVEWLSALQELWKTL